MILTQRWPFSFRNLRNSGELTEQNRVVRYYGVAQDITERKNAEEALRQNEGRRRQFLEKLKTLHEVSLELSNADSFDELCRQAVDLGRRRGRHDDQRGGDERARQHAGTLLISDTSYSTKLSSSSTGSPYLLASLTTCGSRSAIRKPLSIIVVSPTFTVMSKTTQS